MSKTRTKRFASILAVSTAAALIAGACGGDDEAEETTTTAAATETTAAATETTAAATETTAAGTETTAGGTAPATLNEMLGVKNDLSAVSCDMGAVLALTGPGSFYGKTMTRGIETAQEVMKAAGGPTFNFEYWDHKSGDPAAGVQAMTEMQSKGITVKLASYVDDLGAMLAQTAENKVFTLDGGGGTSIFGQGKPYFWGTRAITPNDTLPGVFQWFKETYPDKKTVGLIGWDLGGELNEIIKVDVLAKLEAAGLEFNGLYELNAVGATDYAQSISKIKANEPDLLIVSIYGQDPGAFANQAATAGIKSVQVGSEFTPDGVNASKGTWEQNGWTFAYDFFDPNSTALNPLAKLFVDTFRAKFNEDPDFYAANFFENTLRFWVLMDRAVTDGDGTAETVCNGTILDTEMQQNPTLPSVYGGDAATVGESSHDLTTHSVNKRPMGIFTFKGGSLTAHAYFGINGEGYTKAG
jgi:ABC-type branched-subunit amino acid transport system substrate-binding protein